jgi:hypothetical protein
VAEPSPFLYVGSKTREICFPLGGIGTGSVGLSGAGRFIDWEILNGPDKGSTNSLSTTCASCDTSRTVSR